MVFPWFKHHGLSHCHEFGFELGELRQNPWVDSVRKDVRVIKPDATISHSGCGGWEVYPNALGDPNET